MDMVSKLGINEGITEGDGGANGVVNGAANDGVIHFVYVYVATPARWNELSVSVQSIRQNFRHPHKIFVVGDKPGIKDVIHIPVEQITGRGSKPKDAVRKLMAIANCDMINEDFVYCYDDVILLRPISPDWFKKRIAVEHIKDYSTFWKGAKGIIPDQGWRNLFMKTFAALTKRNQPTYNYETHLPRTMNRVQILETIRFFGHEVCEEALFSSLHYNLHFNKPDILLKEDMRIKAACHRAYDRQERIIAELKGKVWLNYSDPALNEIFKKTITKIMKGEIKV